MKTGVKVLLFVAIGAIVLGIGICVLGLSIGGFNLQNFSLGEAAALETKSITVKDSFSSVDVEMETGDIYFVPSADSSASVEANTTEKTEFSAEVREGTLFIVCKKGTKWYERISLFGGAHEKLTVTIPVKDYALLNIQATTSDIHIPADFTFENAAVKCTTGDGEFAANVKEKLSYDVVTGDLSISKTQPKELAVKCTTGDIKISDVNCDNLTVTGTTGDLTFANTVAKQDIGIKLTTGDVKFSSCDAKNMTVNLVTGDVTGTLLSDKVFKAKATTGDVKVPDTVSGGNCEISLVTGDIDIKIEK
ncbi:MAG: DUF4097 family beta strand repeat protein [Ruminococcus sp.]|nr:DUF4097 family beta strand repeat protein [Ruminococcus sp.]